MRGEARLTMRVVRPSRKASGRVSLDHVLVAVRDLEEAARRFETAYGLRALPGGRHPGAGTANMIIPLGTTYLELIAVVDSAEAAHAPTSQRVARAVEQGRTFAAWAVRTDDLDALRVRLWAGGLATPDPVDGRRDRPDGVTLQWRTLFLAPHGERSVLPFVIEWRVPPGLHPAETPVEHPSGARGIHSVRLGDPDPASAGRRVSALLADDVNAAVEEDRTPGVLAVEVDSPRGALVIR